jgi:hypothetical protein
VDAHLSLRALPVGLGAGWHPLGSGGQTATVSEMSQLREMDLAGGGKEIGIRRRLTYRS